MTSGCGTINFWGFSPAFNFAAEHNRKNILLIGSGDLRHIFAALLEQIKRESDSGTVTEPIHIYVLESRLEVYARNVLLLYILSRETSELSLKEKVELFLEINGNMNIRAATKEMIQKYGAILVKAITDLESMSTIMPFLNFGLLKYKEIDYLETIFKFWREDKQNRFSFDSKFLWDIRLRQLLGTRYDSQKGAFDWDYNMRLCDRDPKVTKVMSPGDYCRWRGSGLAYELREADYVETNRTLISPTALVDKSGEKTVRYGYWGDIVVSPYISLALHSEWVNYIPDKQEKQNPGERPYMATVAQVVVENYMTALVHALATGNVNYTTNKHSDGAIIEEVEPEDTDKCSTGKVIDRIGRLVRIHFLPITAMSDMPRKSRFSNLFDSVFVSISLFHILNEHFMATTLQSDCLLVAETGKYLVELGNEQIQRLEEVITEKLTMLGGKLLPTKNNEAYKSFLLFNYDSSSANQGATEVISEKAAEALSSEENNMSITKDLAVIGSLSNVQK